MFGHALLYSVGWRAFLVQIVMASGWTTPVSFSFNGPVWSVSAEILIYGLFWVVRPNLFGLGVAGPIALALGCLGLSVLPVLSTIWLCGFYFFVGCAVFALHRALHEQPGLRVALAITALCGSVLVIRFVRQGPGVLILFAAIVMLLTAVDRWSSHRLARRLGWLGDSTYGIYLWHIPVQLALLLGVRLAGLGSGVVMADGFFLLYVGTVLAIARLSFTHIEKPMRRYIRQRAAIG